MPEGSFLSTVKSGTRHNLACSSGNKNRRTTPFKRCPAICRALRFNLTYDYLNVIMPKSPSLLLFGPAVKYSALVLPLIEEPPPNSMPQSWSILMGLPFEFVIVPTRAPVVGLNPLMVLVRLLSLPPAGYCSVDQNSLAPSRSPKAGSTGCHESVVSPVSHFPGRRRHIRRAHR
jgi:hypothetical protein